MGWILYTSTNIDNSSASNRIVQYIFKFRYPVKILGSVVTSIGIFMVNHHSFLLILPPKSRSNNLMDTNVRRKEHIAIGFILLSKCPFTIQRSCSSAFFRVSHNGTVISYGIGFSLIFTRNLYFVIININHNKLLKVNKINFLPQSCCYLG